VVGAEEDEEARGLRVEGGGDVVHCVFYYLNDLFIGDRGGVVEGVDGAAELDGVAEADGG